MDVCCIQHTTYMTKPDGSPGCWVLFPTKPLRNSMLEPQNLNAVMLKALRFNYPPSPNSSFSRFDLLKLPHLVRGQYWEEVDPLFRTFPFLKPARSTEPPERERARSAFVRSRPAPLRGLRTGQRRSRLEVGGSWGVHED